MPGSTIYRKQGDTAPPITASLTWGDGTAVDLTSAAVKLNLRLPSGQLLRDHAGVAVLSPATAGRIQYTHQLTDTAIRGKHLFEFEVTFPTGEVVTFPNQDDCTMQVVRQLS